MSTPSKSQPAANFDYPFRLTGASEPELAFAASFWALSGRSTPIEQGVQEACEAGCSFLEVGLRAERLGLVKELLDRFPLQLVAQGFANTIEEAAVYFQRALDLGSVAINLHLGHAYLSAQEAEGLVDAAYEMANSLGLPMLLETHRGRLTQDLFRTSALLDARPHTSLALDVSHYLVAGETLGGSEVLFRQHIQPLLRQTRMIHGRISNGQSIQVHSMDAFSFKALTEELWTEAMSLWLENAPAGAVLIFEPELGPPPYAFVDPATRGEVLDRTEQSRELKAIAFRAWDAAKNINARKLGV